MRHYDRLSSYKSRTIQQPLLKIGPAALETILIILIREGVDPDRFSPAGRVNELSVPHVNADMGNLIAHFGGEKNEISFQEVTA